MSRSRALPAILIFLAGVTVGVVADRFLAGRRDVPVVVDAEGGSLAPRAADEPAALDVLGSRDPSASREAARSQGPAEPASPAPAEPTLEELVALLRDGDGWPDEKRALEELVALGTEEAMTVVLEYMEDGAHRPPQDARLLEELLRDVDDPRIAGVATRVLDRQIFDGETSWTTGPYGAILARHGTPADRARLLGYAEDGEIGSQLRSAIGRSLAELGDPALTPMLLDAAARCLDENDWPTGAAILEGMAASGGAAVSPELLAIAREQSDQATRGFAYAAWGASLDGASAVADVVGEFRGAPPGARDAVFDAFGSVLSNLDGGERAIAFQQARPMFHEALVSGDQAEVLSAFSFISGRVDLVPRELAPALRVAQEDPSLEIDTRRRMLATARKIEER